jgi:hypothetical protein
VTSNEITFSTNSNFKLNRAIQFKIFHFSCSSIKVMTQFNIIKTFNQTLHDFNDNCWTTNQPPNNVRESEYSNVNSSTVG